MDQFNVPFIGQAKKLLYLYFIYFVSYLFITKDYLSNSRGPRIVCFSSIERYRGFNYISNIYIPEILIYSPILYFSLTLRRVL